MRFLKGIEHVVQQNECVFLRTEYLNATLVAQAFIL